MFLQTNDRIVNLKNVSNINILNDKNRIVFNLNYNIEMPSNSWNSSKMISDYVYWDAISNADLEQNITHILRMPYFIENFISSNDNNVFINLNEISSVKFSEKKTRVIFNLSNPVTFKDYDGNEKITSDFVYVNCYDLEDYKNYVEQIKQKIIKG